MKEKLIGWIKTYFLFVFIFILQKPLFLLYYSALYAETAWTDIFRVIWNGLPLDFSLAGYLTAIPGLLFIVSAWTLSATLRRIWRGYYLFVSILLSVIFVVDLGLYEYWGFRLDATPIFYFSLLLKTPWQASACGRWREECLRWCCMPCCCISCSCGYRRVSGEA